MLDAENVDPSLHVQVSPSQNAYFAGETFSVTVTFTNARLFASPVPKSHKRNAHSISSAPLARPPTSPGLGPRPPDFVRPLGLGLGLGLGLEAEVSEGRKGLIGCVSRAENGKEVLEARRSALEREKEKARSASLDITVGEVGVNGHGPYVQAYEFDPTPAPEIHRTSFPLPPKHPHARRQSVFDGHPHLKEVQPLHSPSSASTSAFTLALDPIAEMPPSLTRSPSPASTTSTLISEVHSYPLHTSPYIRKHHHPSLGLGHPPLPLPPRSASHEHLPPNTTLLLYSYLQLSGTAHILPHGPVPPALSNLRAQLLKRPVIGGGSMDIARTRTRGSHPRSASLTGSLLSLLSPSSYSPSPGRSRGFSGSSKSDVSDGTGGVGLGLGLGLSTSGGEGEEEMPLPVFEAQPAMLAVDLALRPGESRSYTYTLPLSSTLPPTFRGRMIRFSYELVVGTCRHGDTGGGTGTGVTVSRVMKVPIRVYNWVSVCKPQRPYDLLAPVRKPNAGKVQDLGSAVGDGGDTKKKPPQGPTPGTARCGSLDELRAYGERLLSTFPAEGSTGVRIKEPAESVPECMSSSPSGGHGVGETVDPLRAFERVIEREREGEEGEVMSCGEAVEILTRNPKKVSYDVTRDNIKFAVLTFTKSAYRLGETVLGVVEMNERGGRGKVISLSVTLETNETLPGSLTPLSASTAHTRRIHGEHHASFTGSTLRTTFGLDIPSDACPSFGVAVSGEGGPGKVGGLSWKVHLTLLVAVTSPNARVRGLIRDGSPTAWGSGWRAPAGIAPEEQDGVAVTMGTGTKQSWTAYLVNSLIGTGEREGDVEWREVGVEVVECEVPVVVWPGNTAFSAVDVVFDV